MTAGILKFWQKDFDDRPTIAYAVSVDHARNLASVFNDADIPAAVILGDTSSEERNKAIAGFREGTVKVLVNCGDAHELVCDLCHTDAHIQAHLPVTKPLDELIDTYSPEDEMLSHDYPELNGELANRLAGLFKELLEQERRSVTGASDDRQRELLEKIERRETELKDDEELDALFESHIAALPETEQPKTRVQERRMFGDWEGGLKSELDEWKDELDELENQPIDKRLIFNSTKKKAMYLLQREARVADLLPESLGLSDDEEKGKREGKKDKTKTKSKRGTKMYEKKYELVKDYLIPVVRLMKVEDKTHTEAFQLVDKNLGVPRGCASSQCTRTLRFFPEEEFRTQEFVEAVSNGDIIQRAKKKRPQQIELIERELEPLYPGLADSANDATRSLANSAA